MQEQAPQDIRPGAPPSAVTSDVRAGAPPNADIFALKKRFPGDEVASPPPTPAPIRGGNKRRTFLRVALPVVLLILAIGGIAYVMQNLPSRGKPANQPDTPGPLLVVSREKAGPGDRVQAGLFERGKDGHYDYSFHNPNDFAVHLGLQETNCDCSTVHIASPKDWQLLRKDKTKDGVDYVTIPAKGAGQIRVAWTARKSEGSALDLKVILWAQSAKGTKQRQWLTLNTGIFLVAPIVFEVDNVNLGRLSPGEVIKDRRVFVCWSGTRDELKLDVKNDPKDPLFEWKLTPLSKAECDGWNNEKKKSTPVKCGYWVWLTVHERKAEDTKTIQLDQGSFLRYAPFVLDGEPLDMRGPEVQGEVQGEIDIAGKLVEHGMIRFSTFPVGQGITANLILKSEKGIELVSKIPHYLEVTLTPTEQIQDGKKIWKLDVKVPAQGGPAGLLPKDSVVLLRTQTTPSRQISIPIVGNAVQRQ
jgi:hypothetical protein